MDVRGHAPRPPARGSTTSAVGWPTAAPLVLLGPSGAGKSTLVNLLVGEEVQATGAVRAVRPPGPHTTVARELVPVPTGGVLLDTPGIRGLGLWDADEGVTRTFADIDELATRLPVRRLPPRR